MIWFTLFFTIFFFSLKEFSYVNTFFYCESPSIFLATIIMTSLMVVLSFCFNFFGSWENFSYNIFFTLTMMLVLLSFFSNSSFFFLIFLELCVYPMSFVILKFSKDLDKYSSVLFMFGINILGSIPFMIFCSSGTKLFYYEALVSMFFFSDFYIDLVFFMFFFLLLVSKLPLVFFHFWLTKAHVSASGSCSMVLASVMLKLGSFGLYKFFLPFLICTSFFFCWMMSVSILSCFFFCMAMIRFFDLKYLIACSSILHMSLMFPFLCGGSSEGVISSLFMMAGHGLVSYFLFFLVSIMYESSYNRSVDFNKCLESLAKTSTMILLVFTFLNLGFPPFINFFSEYIFLVSSYSSSFYFSFLFCLMSFISVIFTMFLVTKSIFGKKSLYSSNSTDEPTLNFYSLKILISFIFLPFFF